MKRKILSIILAFILILSMNSVNFTALAEEQVPMFVLDKVSVGKGDTVAVKVLIENNPGVWGLDLRILYNKTALQLESVENGDFFAAGDWIKGVLTNPIYILSYANTEFEDIMTQSAALATLNFKVLDTASHGDYEITASYDVGDIINMNFDDINFEISNGNISVHDYSNKVIGDDTLKAKGNCTQNAQYYYSCECGDISTALSFEAENTASHSFDSAYDTECNLCHEIRELDDSVWPYIESFNDKTIEQLSDWSISGSTAINGKLSSNGEVINNILNFENQYISADIKASELSGGFEVRARVSDSDYYSFNVTDNAITLTKSGEIVSSDNTFVFDADKFYRISLGVDSNVLTTYIHDYTDTGIVKTLTYTDTQEVLPKGKFGFFSADSTILLDNVYFSTLAFNTNDIGWKTDDINGDRIFDIRDLVYTYENKGTSEDNIKARADKDNDKSVTDTDIKVICKKLLSMLN